MIKEYKKLQREKDKIIQRGKTEGQAFEYYLKESS
jgi:hypothetical protein